jgi:hypothetical protein
MDWRILQDTPPWEWPEDTSEVLLDVLRDERAAEPDRLLAAELAGDCTVVNDQLVETLMSILHAPDEPVPLRQRAAISLGPVLELVDLDGFDDPDDLPISESTFDRVTESLQKLYMDLELPRDVRRRILEASVRAPRDWHRDAIHAAYSSDEPEWTLTAVFAMRWINGFDKQILESLGSANEDIHCEALLAAGTWSIRSAWSHISKLVESKDTAKPLLLAAIEVAAGIRPKEAGMLVESLCDSDDEDIADAAYEAIAMAEVLTGDAVDDEDDDL